MRMTRRALLQGDTTGGGVHISSLVLHCRPEVIGAVIPAIEALPGATVPEHSEQGKLVVLLETANDGTVMERISALEALSGVISVALVYHQIDVETESEPETGSNA
ncbi:MAG: chaperone NapD [Halioglobus sp.]